MTRREEIALLKAQLRDSVPGVRVVSASEAHNAYMIRRPSGIADFDLATNGGIPAGGCTEFSGPENSGKNLMCNLHMAENQRIHGQDSAVAIVGIEYDWDKNFARRLGMTVPYSDSEIRGLEEEAGYEYSDEVKAELKAEVGEIELISAVTAEEALEAMYQFIASDYFQIVVLDSIGSLLTSDESEAPITEQKMYGMGIPKVMARFFRKMTKAYQNCPHGRPNLTSLIATNQLMVKIGGFVRPGMPAPTQQKGGWAVRHGKLLGVALKKGTWEQDGKTKVGHMVDWRIEKGKAGCSDGASSSFKFYTDEERFGPDMETCAYRVGIESGIFTKAGSVYSAPMFGIDRIRSKAAFWDAIREHEGWYRTFYREMLLANGIEAYNRWAEVEG